MGVYTVSICSVCFVLGNGYFAVDTGIAYNLKSFRYKDGIVVFITIAIIIVSVMFYRHITKIMISYNAIIQDTNGVPEIGLAVLDYRKYALVYVIVSNILSMINTIVAVMNSRKKKGGNY